MKNQIFLIMKYLGLELNNANINLYNIKQAFKRMANQDASKIRERILSILRMKGPTLPVYISQEVGISMLFASAFLAELLSEKLIKISNMRVGNSPIYYLSGQEQQLEKFSNYLKSKEKEAFLMIQEKKFLKDSEQSPAIRVALREIKDFAFPFKRGDEVFWRYLTSRESEFKYGIKSIEEHRYVEPKPREFDKKEREIGEKIIKDIKIENIEKVSKEEIREIEPEEEEPEELEESEEAKETEKSEKTSKEEIEDKRKEKDETIKSEIPVEKKKEEQIPKETKKLKKEKIIKPKAKPKTIKASKKKVSQKQDDKFFNKIKEFLSKETIEILSIESFDKNEIHLKIRSKGEEKLLVAYNKKKILETDIINANKKASQLKLKYVLLSMGEPPKKVLNLIEAIQNLDKVEKIES